MAGQIVLTAASSGTVTLTPADTGNVFVATIPAVTGNLVSTGSTGVVSQPMLAAGVAGNGPAFRAFMANAQTISATTFTKLNFNTESFDTNSNYSTVTNRFTPTVAGYYQVTANTYFSATAQLYIYKNGSANITGAYVNSVGHFISGLVFLNGSTDYIEIFYFGSAGITTSNNSEFANQFSGFLARAA
jgi:hypothetical protein